jgi:hypothetical protein
MDAPAWAAANRRVSPRTPAQARQPALVARDEAVVRRGTLPSATARPNVEMKKAEFPPSSLGCWPPPVSRLSGSSAPWPYQSESAERL